MAVDLKQQLERVSAKTHLFLERQKALRAKIKQADDEIRRLKAEILARDAEIQKLKLDNEYLRLVKSVAADPTELRKAKVIISKLVREIDRCILDLND